MEKHASILESKQFILALKTCVIILLILSLIIEFKNSRDLYQDEAYYIQNNTLPITAYSAQIPLLLLSAIIIFFLLGLYLYQKKTKKIIIITALSLTGITCLTLSNIHPIDVHPPTYFIFLHYWSIIFGNNPLSLRAINAIISIFFLITIWKYCKENHTEQTALITTLIIATSTTWIYYATYIRPYILLAFLSTISFIQFQRMMREKTPMPWTYFLITTLMVWIHYFAAIIPLAHFIISWKKTNLKQTIENYAPLSIMLIPLAWFFLIQNARVSPIILNHPTISTYLSIIPNSIINIGKNPLPNTLMIILTLTYYTLIIISLTDKKNRMEIATLFILPLIIIIPAIWLDCYSIRYILPILWMAPLLISKGIITISKINSKIAFIILFSIISINIITQLQPRDHTLQEISQIIPNQSIILHDNTYSLYPIKAYLPQSKNILLTNLTHKQISLIGGDPLPPKDIFYSPTQLPQFTYYITANPVINTENMTLLEKIGPLQIWKKTI